ncbi:MAG: tRNA (guanosine(37)-N1)-methyltransferase TrmD [Planctomycetes bacterium]|nr:tRNA (guanosine(37)-N1)-methyltransferase TrmD [Planctomycetota bacterium]
MEIHVHTIFPELFSEFVKTSIVGIAIERGLVNVYVHDFRDYSDDKHRKVDDTPFGGGPGMILRCQPVVDSVREVEKKFGSSRKILLTPSGKPLSQTMLAELSREKSISLICGRYEGFDARIRTILGAEEVSAGDYILSGGEVPAMLIAEGVTRLIEGALGSEESKEKESFEDNLLESPGYTKPREYEGHRIPGILCSGDHGKIEGWRKEQSKLKTREIRPDLYEKHKRQHCD